MTCCCCSWTIFLCISLSSSDSATWEGCWYCDSSGVYICKSIVNYLRHGNYIWKSEEIYLGVSMDSASISAAGCNSHTTIIVRPVLDFHSHTNTWWPVDLSPRSLGLPSHLRLLGCNIGLNCEKIRIELWKWFSGWIVPHSSGLWWIDNPGPRRRTGIGLEAQAAWSHLKY